MIARFWTAKIARAAAAVYVDHFKNQLRPTLKKVDGYLGARLLERETTDAVEIVVITFWQSLDSVSRFAGSDLEKAVVSDEIVPLLLDYDQRVRHYNVAVNDNA